MYEKDLQEVLGKNDNAKKLKFVVVNSCYSGLCGE